MNHDRYFAAAPWPTVLQVSSTVATVLVLVIGVAAHRGIPATTGFTHAIGWAVLMFPVVLLLWSLLATVRGFSVGPGSLVVHRLGWQTRYPLADVSRVYFDAALCKRAVRVFGNGGLFGFTGLYYHRELGRFRLFATDLRQTVVLQTRDRTLVISPAEAQALVAHVHRLHPGAQTVKADGTP